jgi:hypothetical protein
MPKRFYANQTKQISRDAKKIGGKTADAKKMAGKQLTTTSTK